MTEQIQLSKREIYRRWRVYKREFRRGLKAHFTLEKQMYRRYWVAERARHFDKARQMMDEIQRSI